MLSKPAGTNRGLRVAAPDHTPGAGACAFGPGGDASTGSCCTGRDSTISHSPVVHPLPDLRSPKPAGTASRLGYQHQCAPAAQHSPCHAAATGWPTNYAGAGSAASGGNASPGPRGYGCDAPQCTGRDSGMALPAAPPGPASGRFRDEAGTGLACSCELCESSCPTESPGTHRFGVTTPCGTAAINPDHGHKVLVQVLLAAAQKGDVGGWTESAD
mmetsp:Transcript_40771/g.94604  ORF Transcript_40771/g.94604 Transcript_40771/m.94604 type:complete len:215 (+) Transcript_40771:651-1295(+)